MTGLQNVVRKSMLTLGALVALSGIALGGWIVFTLYCWVVYQKDPDIYLRERREDSRYEKLRRDGRYLTARIRSAFPDGLSDWQQLPYRNDLAGDYYQTLTPFEMKFDQRRADGSDNLLLRVVVNPAVGQMPDSPVNPLIPDVARPLGEGPWSIAVIHSALDWNALIPEYDQRSGYGKGVVAQVFIGDWEVHPTDPSYFRRRIGEQREWFARKLWERERERRIASPKMGGRATDDMPPLKHFLPLVKDESLDQIYLLPTSRMAFAKSLTDRSGPAHPRCIAVFAAAKDEATLRWLLAKVDFAALKRITDGQ